MDYLYTYCNPRKNVREWYTLLRITLQINNAKNNLRLVNRYNTVIRPLTRPLRNFEAWINKWSNTMAETQRKGFLITITLTIWFNNIFLTIKTMQPQWAFNLYRIYYKKINNRTLTPQEIGQKLRNQLLYKAK